MEKRPSSKRKKKAAAQETPVEETVLETPVKASEMETVSLSADEVPPTVATTEESLTETETVPSLAESFESMEEVSASEPEAAVAEPEVSEPVIPDEPKVTVDEPRATPVMARSAAAGAGANEGMSASVKALIVGMILLLAGVGLFVWKTRSGGHANEGLTKLTKADMESLLKDANPMMLKRLAEDPEMKKKWAENIKQLLAVAEEARKSDIGKKPETAEELEYMRAQMIAVTYDKEKNKDKEQMPPFSLISKEDVDKYYQTPGNKEKVDKLLKSKIDEAKEAGLIPKDQEPPEEQLNQFKEQYAKTQIYYKEATDNWSKLSEDFKRQAELQVKLQQAQYLARTYAEKYLAKQVEVKDEEIPQYLSAHPDADPDGAIKKYLDEHPVMTKEQKKAKADDLLKRAKAGEDFAKLATENSEDPGSKNDGGLYKDIPMGQMLPEFEKAALALEPGQIADAPVETKYGYHIIKLERKGKTKDKDGKESDTYDARHILIMTTSDDPQSPLAQIKQKIEADKEKKILDDIVARNPIEVAEDFEVKVPPMPEGQPNGLPPGVKMDPKQMEELQRQIREAQEGKAPKDAPKDAPKKPEPKKNK